MIELKLTLTLEERNVLMNTIAYSKVDKQEFLKKCPDSDLKEAYEKEIAQLDALLDKLIRM